MKTRHLAGILVAGLALTGTQVLAGAGANKGIWSHDNLVAWCVVPFDANARGPEQRAAMFEEIGFKNFAYDWREKDIPTFDAEIDAMQRHGVSIVAWWFPFDAGDPPAKATLETFRKHGIHPQLWVAQSFKADPSLKFPKTAQEQEERVAKEAERIEALANLAAPYGCQVELYNHNDWYGFEENELAILAKLSAAGRSDVGMVYNFSHCRNNLHDDTKNFPQIWAAIKDRVVAVNVTGLRFEGKHVYPSQGDRELEMMRVIEDSGWKGRVGLIAEKGGDAKVTLTNYRVGLDWLAAELKQPGSGGPKPFPETP